jgi:adenylate cyclase
MERKLTAILCADVYGYSRLMGENEEATLRTLSSHRKLIDSLIEQHRGRFVNSAGDSVLAEFASVVNAVQCAVEIQRALKAENAGIPSERRMEFRIGVNLGDVMVEGEQIYGDGVNVAARLESLAQRGGICISGTVHDQVRDRLALGYEDAGEQEVKNIARPVRVWRVQAEPGTGARLRARTQRVPRKYVRRGIFSIAGLTIIVGAIVLVQSLSLKPPHTHASIPPQEKPALPLPSIPSIAVLPFANMSAHTSAFTYKGKAVKVQEVSRELGVKYVLEGSVRKAGDNVRITAQLVDATTGADLWAQHYDRPRRDIFALQDEIVQRIVATLKLEFILREQGLIPAHKRSDNLEAFDDFLRGVEYSRSLTKEGNAKARQMFEKAIELDPSYADAYTGLGFTYWSGWANQWEQDSNALDRASELAQRAVALDESLPMAHVLLGYTYLFKKQYDQAITEVQRAIALDPNSGVGYMALTLIMGESGKPEEAIAAVEKAIRLDPRGRDFYLFFEGWAYTQIRRYAEEIPMFKQHLARYPNDLSTHAVLIVDYTELGQEQQAREEAAEVLRISPKFSLDLLMQRAPQTYQAFRKLFYSDLARAGLK